MLRVIALTLVVIALAAEPAGAQVVVATDVTEDTTEANSQPKIGADSHGRIYLTFVKPSGGYSQIFVASSMGGQRWEEQQVTHASAHARYPALAVGPDDTVHLAWTQYDGGTGKVYYARRTDRGWSTPLKVSPGDAYAGIPALVVDAQGTVHMVWYGIRAGAPSVTTRHGSLYEILYTSAGGRGPRPAPNGAGWREPEVISPGIPDSINPALVIDHTGRLHSTWYQFDLRNYQVRHALYDHAWTRPETISSGRVDATAVALAAGANAAVAAVWERRDPSGSHIYFAERTQRWSGQQQISPPTQNAYNPSVTVAPRGLVYVAWDSDGQIYLRRRDGAWLEAGSVTREGKNTHPTIAAATNMVVVAWTQRLGADTRLRVSTITGEGVSSQRARPRWSPIMLGLLAAASYLLWAAWRRRRSRRTT